MKVGLHLASLTSILLALAAGSVRAQQCTDPHYRWTVKNSKALLSQTATRVTVGTILTKWPIPDLYAGESSKCAVRSERETKVYSVTAWVRRRLIEKPPRGDRDWHIELTAKKGGEVEDHCIVVEIPDPEYAHLYQTARDDFNKLVADAGATIDSKGYLSKAVRLRFIGPAFFDAEHRGARGTNNPPHQHGRCNSSSRALWEIHPVFAVRAPPK